MSQQLSLFQDDQSFNILKKPLDEVPAGGNSLPIQTRCVYGQACYLRKNRCYWCIEDTFIKHFLGVEVHFTYTCDSSN